MGERGEIFAEGSRNEGHWTARRRGPEAEADAENRSGSRRRKQKQKQKEKEEKEERERGGRGSEAGGNPDANHDPA